MINNQIEYLFHLCMKLQEGEDGFCDKRQKEYMDKPTAFFHLHGHVAWVEIDLYRNGWTGSDNDPHEKFLFCVDKEIDKGEFDRCRNYLLELINETEEEE